MRNLRNDRKHNRGVWVEKHRPLLLKDVLGQNEAVKLLSSFLPKNGGNIVSMPHFMLEGPPGVGKTSAVSAFVWELFEQDYDLMDGNYLFLNASDERGIKTIQEKVNAFASTRPIDFPVKVVFLSEMGNMTSDAQQALQNPLEKYAGTCKFFFDLNYKDKIREPILDRVTEIQFYPLSDEILQQILIGISEKENLSVTMEEIEAIINVSNGSARRAIKHMQFGNIPNTEYLEYPRLMLNMSIRYIREQEDNGDSTLLQINNMLKEYTRSGFSAKNIVKDIVPRIALLSYEKIIKAEGISPKNDKVAMKYVKLFKAQVLKLLTEAAYRSRNSIYIPTDFMFFFSSVIREYHSLVNALWKC